MNYKKILITGVAGFIGSNYSRYILQNFKNTKIVGIDNLSVGSKKNLKDVLSSNRFIFYKMNLENKKKLLKISQNCDLVIHLASNADIAKAINDPLIDYRQGFKL